MAGNTALDVLVAEMLGDIGKLHDQVVELKTELPAILDQVHLVISNFEAKANAPQQTAQRALEGFIRNELRTIAAATKQAKNTAVNALETEILAAVNKGWGTAQARGNRTFDVAAARFNVALDESVKVAENRATETLKGLCQDLKNRIEQIRLERLKSRWLSMVGACISTGSIVGALAVYILK